MREGVVHHQMVHVAVREIPESEAFEGQRNSSAQPGIAHLLSAFRGPYLWLTIKVSLMVMGAQGGVWAEQFEYSAYHQGHAGSGAREGGRAEHPEGRHRK
jgi:hypothetical protein